jgi:hypothetical protein
MKRTQIRRAVRAAFDMAGHAQRAKDLLSQANEEMKLAAMAANREK